MAFLTGVSFCELLLTVISGGDAIVGDEPAWLGGLGTGCGGSLTLVPLAGKLSVLADAGAAGGDLILTLGSDKADQQSGNNEKLKGKKKEKISKKYFFC